MIPTNLTFLRNVCWPLLLLSLPTLATASDSADAIAGLWYGSGWQPDESRYPIHWILDRRADGTFRLATYEEIECTFIPWTSESGRWELDGSTYTVTTLVVNSEAVDTSDSYYRDVYTVNHATEDRLIYTHKLLGMEFDSRRIPEDFNPIPIMPCN